MPRCRIFRVLATSTFVVWAAFSSGACAAEEGPERADYTTISTGDFGVRFNAQALSVELVRRGEVLLALPADGIVLGRVDAVADSANYDPYPMLAGGFGGVEPAGLRWLAVSEAKLAAHDSESLTLELTHEEGVRSRIVAQADGEGRFGLRLEPADAAGDRVAYFRLKPRVDAVEAFYGLGEVFDQVNHRGTHRAMQLELDPSLESSYNEAHVPIPFVIGTRAWGLFVESPYPASFEIAKTEPDRLDIVFGTGVATGAGLDFHLFAADHPLDVTKRYYEVTGYPALPARWALGPWIWRDENADQAQVEGDLATIRDLDLATTAYWIDRPYATGVNTFDFDAARFPDPARMIQRMHELGFRTALWHTPYLDEKDDATLALRQEAETKGYYPIESPGTVSLTSKWGRPIDLTNPDAVAWWQSLVRRYTDLGVEGFKLDYGEDVVVGIGSARNVFRFANGSDERTMHAEFQLFYHRTYAELLPQSGGFLLCRGGTYGDQRHVSVIWPGDLDANFARFGDPMPATSQKYVGGLPASVVAGLSLGPSGFPFFGADTGGYRHSPPDKETFTRWFQQTALSTVMQIGTSSNDVAWEPTAENGFDAEMLDWYRRYTRLHLRLFPYLWTFAQRIAQDGRPIQRALGLAYPELGEHPSDTYLLGDALLVAPVIERDAREREVLFPSGRWFDWWTGEARDGGDTGSRARVAAPLDTLPLFLKESAFVAMLRPTIDTLSATMDPTRVDSYETTPGVLWARVAPGAAPAEFVVFDGATVAFEPTSDGFVLRSKDGSELAYGVLFEVIALGGRPSSVSVDGAAFAERASLAELEAAADGWAFDASATAGTLFIKVASGEHEAQVTR